MGGAEIVSALDVYDGRKPLGKHMMILRVTQTRPFFLEDVLAARRSSSRSPRITFAKNQRLPALEALRMHAEAEYEIGAVFKALVYLDAAFIKERGLERQAAVWKAYLISRPERAVVPLVEAPLTEVRRIEARRAEAPPPPHRLEAKVQAGGGSEGSTGTGTSTRSSSTQQLERAINSLQMSMYGLQTRVCQLSAEIEQVKASNQKLTGELKASRDENKRLKSHFKGLEEMMERRTESFRRILKGNGVQ